MKNLVFLSILIVLMITISEAQEIKVLTKNMVYKEMENLELTVDMFYPDDIGRDQSRPAIAFFHGGGWVFGNPDEFHGACVRYAEKGFVTFSFQYRLSINKDGTYPDPDISPVESVKDARTAIRWLRENAEELNIDPNKIIASGQSAGGQLALSTALMDDINEENDNLRISPEPNALLLYSSCVNTMEAWIDNLLVERRQRIWDISPYHNLKSGMPPTIAFHGNADCMVMYYTVLFFNDRMKELGNDFELVTLEGRDHYLGEGSPDEEKYARYFDEEIMERSDLFLKQNGFLE